MKILGGTASRARITLLVAISGAIFAFPSFAHAATLFLSPSSGQFSVGKAFTVTVRVNSQSTAINASEGMLSFNPAQLQVQSISSAGSIFNLNVQEPEFSNTAGTVRWTGVILNPGYTGASGNLITVTFKGKTPGTVKVLFSSGAVLANDGKGTNVLTGMSGGTYAMVQSAATPTPTPTESELTPVPEQPAPIAAPVIETYPLRADFGTTVTITGRADPLVTVRVVANRGGSTVRTDTVSDGNGQWSAAFPELEKGLYYTQAFELDAAGALSEPSNEVTFRVGNDFFDSLRRIFSGYGWLRWLLWLLFLLLMIWFLYWWIFLGALKRDEEREKDTLAELRDDIEDELAILVKVSRHRQLYPEEVYLRSKLFQYRKTVLFIMKEMRSRLAKRK